MEPPIIVPAVGELEAWKKLSPDCFGLLLDKSKRPRCSRVAPELGCRLISCPQLRLTCMNWGPHFPAELHPVNLSSNGEGESYGILYN
jgi:hypothetical protein